MAKKQPPSPSDCDFETGLNLDEPATNIMRQAQVDLYKMDNPYVGNKRKIVVDIAKSLEAANVPFSTMADVFSGSSVVGLFFKLLGKKVISNDLLTSSYMNAVSFVENPGLSLAKESIEWLCNQDNRNKNDFVRKNYANRFTEREALFLDNYRANIDSLMGSFPQHPDLNNTNRIYKALAFVLIEHYVMNRCYLGGRLNNGQILAKLEHRLQHQRNDGHEMNFKLGTLPIFHGDGCSASNLDCLDFLDTMPEVDLCYLDPPYGQEQSDYASMFAFCEEYVYGVPIDELPHIQKSAKKFASSKEFETHFRDVLEKASKKAETVVVSFNDSSWADAPKVKGILGNYKKSVEVTNMDYEYKYRKERGDATEYLFIAR